MRFILAFVIGMLLCFLFQPARGHDHNRPDLDNWYTTLKSPGGGPCCGGPKTDGTVLEDNDWEVTEYAGEPPRYRVRINGEWIDVPEDKVVKEPNLAGHTMVWIYKIFDGTIMIRCFLPGAMT